MLSAQKTISLTVLFVENCLSAHLFMKLLWKKNLQDKTKYVEGQTLSALVNGSKLKYSA